VSGVGSGLVITQRRQLAPVITIAAGAATGGYAGSLYQADQPGGVWQADGVDLPGETAQDWTMTLALEGRAITYRVGARVSNAIQMWMPTGLPSLIGAFDIRQGLYLDGARMFGWTPLAGPMNYVQPIVAQRPSYQPTGADGRPEIASSYGTDFRSSNLPPAPTARSFVALMRFGTSDPSNWHQIYANGRSNTWTFGKRWAAGSLPSGARTLGLMTSGFANMQESSAGIVDGNTYMVAAQTARPAGDYRFRINGAAAGGGTSSVPAFVNNAGDYTIALLGGLSSHVIADSYLSVADVARIEGAIAWQLGDAGRLAAGHPHKSAAPRVS